MKLVMPRVSIINQWKISNSNEGYAVILGLKYSFWSDYEVYRQKRFGIAILGFSVELQWPCTMSREFYFESRKVRVVP